MATMTDVVRRIQIQASQTGASETAAALNKIATAQGNVAVATATTDKATLSMQGKLASLQKSLDSEYASEAKMASIEKTLTAARNQGIVSIERENELLSLASAKYVEAGASAELMARGMEVAGEAGKGLLASLGPLVALTALAELPSKIMESTAAVAKLGESAQTIGVGTKALQELDYAAGQTGVSTDTMNEALSKFSKNLGIAATGTGVLAKVLKENHVTISGDLTKDLENYAKLIQNSTNAEQRNYLTTAAFGKGAAELGRLFSDGADGIKRLADEADNANVILSDGTIETAHSLTQEFTSLETQLNVTFEDFMVNIAPALEQTLSDLTKVVRAANAAVNAAKWAADQVDNVSKPLSQRSDDFIQNDIKTMQTLIASANSAMSGNFTFKGVLAAGAGGSHIPGYQAQLAADQEEMARRAAAIDMSDHASSIATGVAGNGYKPTITRNTSGDAAAAKQASEIQKVTDSLNLQTKALTETDRQKEIDNELSKAHVSASSAEGKAITDLAGKFYDEKQAIDQANQAAAFLAQTTETAFAGIIDGSTSVTDALANIVKALEQAVIQAALLGSGPLANIFGGAPTTSGATGGILGSLLSAFIPHAMGGVYSSPDLSSYRNQVVDKPTLFRFASGGVFGEAGPEAIMPLSRGSDGRLGVVSSGNDNGLELNVQIVHQPGASDSATAKKDGNKLNLVALVGDAASQSLKTPGSSMNRTLRVGFGARPALTRRGG